MLYQIGLLGKCQRSKKDFSDLTQNYMLISKHKTNWIGFKMFGSTRALNSTDRLPCHVLIY